MTPNDFKCDAADLFIHELREIEQSLRAIADLAIGDCFTEGNDEALVQVANAFYALQVLQWMTPISSNNIPRITHDRKE